MRSVLRRFVRGAWLVLLLTWSTTAVVSAATPTPLATRTSGTTPTTNAPKATPSSTSQYRGETVTPTPRNATGSASGATPTPSAPGGYLTTYWSDVAPISEKLSSWFPDVALDSAGTTHIVWNSSEETAATTTTDAAAPTPAPNIRDYLMYQRFGATPQPPATDIGLSHGGEAIRNAIVADRDGTLDVLYRSQEQIWFIKAPVDTAVNARAWSAPRRLSGNGTAYYAAITQDDAGVLHVVYSQNVLIDTPQGSPSIRRQSLFYRHSTDGGTTWSAPVRISSPTSMNGNTRPQVRIQGSTVVIAWDEGYDNINAISNPTEGNIRRSLDGGDSWQPIQVIADVAGPIEQLTFAFGLDGQALLVWRVTTADVVRYAASDDAGATWGEVDTVPNLVARPYLDKHQFDRYALIADGTGRFHLLAVGQDGSPDRVALMHLEFSDMVWSLPEIVFDGEGYPEYPGAVTDGGNRLIITFFVRDKLFDIGNYRVWRAEARNSASVIDPQAVRTPKPTASLIKPAAPGVALGTPVTRPGSILPDERPTIDRPIGIPPLGQSIFAAFGLAMAVAIGRIWWMKRP